MAGDFNAKSVEWGFPFDDRRGELLAEMTSSIGLVVLNTGAPTFVRRDTISHIDVTFASHKLVQDLESWEVLDDECLSPHKHILLTLCHGNIKKMTIRRKLRLDSNKFQEQLTQWFYNKTEKCNHLDITKALIQSYRKTVKNVTHETTKIPYWWNDNIEQTRKECIQLRTLYTRCRSGKNLSETDQETKWAAYKAQKKILNLEISKAKRERWQRVCDDLNSDIWDEGYKIVHKNIKQGNPMELSRERKQEVVNLLFPQRTINLPEKLFPVKFTNFFLLELQRATTKMKKKKAPGPDGVPTEALLIATSKFPDKILYAINQCLENQEFPCPWKTAKLVLIAKLGKPPDLPGSYRPLCLINSIAKLFEHLIKERLEHELERRQPLSEMQFGFVKGRSTTHAMTEITRTLESLREQKGGEATWCALITLDVRNAFNTVSWSIIIEELQRRKIPQYLINIVTDYFRNRIINVEKDYNFDMTAGIPQGSVLGPLLWNIQYDHILTKAHTEKVKIIGYADDITLLVKGRYSDELMDDANQAISTIQDWLMERSLQLAPDKTEAVILRGKRNRNYITFRVGSVEVRPEKSLKYLGVVFGENMSFTEHVKYISHKSLDRLGKLQRLMPNIEGPIQSCKRNMLYGVVQSIVLYGAPVWCNVTRLAKYNSMLQSVQRRALLRVISGYRTISTAAVQVIAGIPPIDLLIEERSKSFTMQGKAKQYIRNDTIKTWQERWQNETEKGQWTKKLISNLGKWVNCKHRKTNYFITQDLSGHASFKCYTHRIKKI